MRDTGHVSVPGRPYLEVPYGVNRFMRSPGMERPGTVRAVPWDYIPPLIRENRFIGLVPPIVVGPNDL
jgi:hypothetical protein